jgi:hydroxypyruvate isomerase
MPRFAANLSFQYQEYSFLERFAAAAADGFKGVEYLFPYAFEPEQLAELLGQNHVEQVLFNAPPGDWDRGERGIASLPGREDEFKQGIADALRYAAVLGNQNIHVMAGLIAPEHDAALHRRTYVNNLRYAAAQAAEHRRSILIEPINTRDMPGYLLNRQDDAHAIREKVGATNLRVQCDLYHAQIVEGDLAYMLRRWIDHVGHIQIASVPTRNEPDTGEVNYTYLFQLLDELCYDGWIGCEYRPRAGTSEGLGWLLKRSPLKEKHSMER